MSLNILYYYCGDTRFEFPMFDGLCTSILSLRYNRKKPIKVHVAYTGLSDDQLETLSGCSSGDFEVSPFKYTPTAKLLSEDQPASQFFQKIDALRQVDATGELVYVDADTIVRCDICDFASLCHDQDKPLCGILDYRQPDDKRREDYVNAGILYIRDIEEFRKRTVSTKDIPKAFDIQWMRFGDQDYINSIYTGDIGIVSQEYNVMIPVYTGGSLNSINAFYGASYTSKEEYLLSSKILHYSWNAKPHSKRCPEWASTVYDMYYNLRNKYIVKQVKTEKGPQKIKKILLARKHRAFGDWIIFADVLKAINDTYPEIQVDVEANGNARTDILTECGCRYRLVANPDIKDYDGYDPHVLYNTNPVTPNKHIIISALENTCSKIPILNIKDFVLINLVSPVVLPEDYKIPDGEYVIVPHYYPPLVSSRVKDYSQENYNRLVSLLSSRYKVFELNSGNVEHGYSTNDKSYSDSTGVITTKQLGETAKLLKHAKFCVLIENGMNHWACHNGARSYCIFKSPVHARPDSLRYNTMIPIECYNDESPEYVFSEIMKHEENR